MFALISCSTAMLWLHREQAQTLILADRSMQEESALVGSCTYKTRNGT